MWNKRVKAHLILIFSTNTNCESMAYRSFRPSGFEARGVRKVTTCGSFTARCATEASRHHLTPSLGVVSGNALKLRESPKAEATKPLEPIEWWPCRDRGYGKNAFRMHQWAIRSQAPGPNRGLRGRFRD